MAFTIVELRQIESDTCHALVEHCGRHLAVALKTEYSKALALPMNFTAELDYHSVIRFEAGLAKDDLQSGLFPTDDPTIIIADGSVHNHVKIGADHVLIDIYIQNGPEFVTLTSEELGDTVPAMGTRIRAFQLPTSFAPMRTPV